MTRARSARRLMAALAALAPLAAPAATNDARAPVQVRAHKVEVDERTGVSIYRGDVVMKQGSLELRADRVEVTTRDGRLQRLHATGTPTRVRARTAQGEELRASALRAEYHAGKRTLDLYGQVALQRDADVFRGAKAHYDLATDQFTATGNGDGRVTAVIQPPAPEAAPR